MAQASNISLRFDQVSKTFEEGTDRRTVLNQVTGSFKDGEFVALLGKSGSGKSTLLNLISGIDEPSAGYIHLGNICISSLGERERTLFRRDHIGFVFQFFNLISTLTVLENVTLPLELAGMKRRKAEEYAMVLLQRVGLGDRRGSFPDRLSGGEQQRVAIARALVNNPALILADEPTGNLDEDTGRHIIHLLLELSRNAGKSLIVATHSPEIAGQADRVFRIHEGRLMESGVN
jgi:putative ABC transport system ATP-binding protein